MLHHISTRGADQRYIGAMPTKKSGGKRTTIKPKGDARYIRRDERGRIKESDDAGRSLKKGPRKEGEKNSDVWIRRSRRPKATLE